jgi:hypothetical protein
LTAFLAKRSLSGPDGGRSAAEGKQGSMKPLRGGEGGIAVLRVAMASYLKAVGPGDSDEPRTDHRAPE